MWTRERRGNDFTLRRERGLWGAEDDGGDVTKRVPVREYDPSTAITVSAGLSQAAVKPQRDAAGRITSDTRTSNAASLTHTDRIYLCRRGSWREARRRRKLGKFPHDLSRRRSAVFIWYTTFIKPLLITLRWLFFLPSLMRSPSQRPDSLITEGNKSRLVNISCIFTLLKCRRWGCVENTRECRAISQSERCFKASEWRNTWPPTVRKLLHRFKSEVQISGFKKEPCTTRSLAKFLKRATILQSCITQLVLVHPDFKHCRFVLFHLIKRHPEKTPSYHLQDNMRMNRLISPNSECSGSFRTSFLIRVWWNYLVFMPVFHILLVNIQSICQRARF